MTHFKRKVPLTLESLTTEIQNCYGHYEKEMQATVNRIRDNLVEVNAQLQRLESIKQLIITETNQLLEEYEQQNT